MSFFWFFRSKDTISTKSCLFLPFHHLKDTIPVKPCQGNRPEARGADADFEAGGDGESRFQVQAGIDFPGMVDGFSDEGVQDDVLGRGCEAADKQQ